MENLFNRFKVQCSRFEVISPNGISFTQLGYQFMRINEFYPKISLAVDEIQHDAYLDARGKFN